MVLADEMDRPGAGHDDAQAIRSLLVELETYERDTARLTWLARRFGSGLNGCLQLESDEEDLYDRLCENIDHAAGTWPYAPDEET